MMLSGGFDVLVKWFSSSSNDAEYKSSWKHCMLVGFELEVALTVHEDLVLICVQYQMHLKDYYSQLAAYIR